MRCATWHIDDSGGDASGWRAIAGNPVNARSESAAGTAGWNSALIIVGQVRDEVGVGRTVVADAAAGLGVVVVAGDDVVEADGAGVAVPLARVARVDQQRVVR